MKLCSGYGICVLCCAKSYNAGNSILSEIMTEVLTFEERKRRYIESVKEEHKSSERNWWQYPAPSYYLMDEYAKQFPHAIDLSVPAVFKPHKKQWLIGASVAIVGCMLLFIVGEQRFGFWQALFLAAILLFVLPSLLDNRPRIIVNREGIWLHKDIHVLWSNIVAMYIKETHQEKPVYSFIVLYYKQAEDDFVKIEIELDDPVSPGLLASAIEQFRESGNQETIAVDNTKPL